VLWGRAMGARRSKRVGLDKILEFGEEPRSRAQSRAYGVGTLVRGALGQSAGLRSWPFDPRNGPDSLGCVAVHHPAAGFVRRRGRRKLSLLASRKLKLNHAARQGQMIVDRGAGGGGSANLNARAAPRASDYWASLHEVRASGVRPLTAGSKSTIKLLVSQGV